MSNSNELFFRLWSGSLNASEREALEKSIASSPAQRRAYEEACAVFEGLRSASKVHAKVDSAFAAQVMSQVHAVGLKKKERLFMKTRKLLMLGILVVLAGGGLALSTQGMHEFLGAFEGSLGAILFMVCSFAGLFSILRKDLKVASGFCAAALALFMVRSQTETFFNDQLISSGARSERVPVASSTIPANAGAPANSSVSVNAGALAGASLSKDKDGQAAGAKTDQTIVFNQHLRALQEKKSEAPPPPQEVAETEEIAAPVRGAAAPVSKEIAPVAREKQIGLTGAGAQVSHWRPSNGAKLSSIREQTADSAIAYQAPAPGLPPTSYQAPSYQSSERYGSYEEHVRTAVQTQAFSTFAADVDTGSYSNLRRFVAMGSLPPPDAVRIEELVNYFTYHYKTPTETPLGVDYEIAPSPFDKNRHLVRFGVTTRAASQERLLPWNLVFLIDVSGSMSDANKLPLVKQSLKLLADSMRPEDKVSIVTYAGVSGVALEPTDGSNKEKIRSVIDLLGAGGSTNGEGGIKMAYDLAQRSFIRGGVNRVVLATDGDFNVGTSSHPELMTLIEEKRRTGVTLTTLGFGTGNLNEHMMEQLANRGNGNFFYIDSFQEAEKVLKKDLVANMQVAAKDVKLQVEFNPRQVKEYRLLGFDNRKLNKEDFTNDAKDAGELGLGHQVTAIYEVLLASSPLDPESLQGSRYQKPEGVKVPAEYAGELGFLRIRYKEPEGEISKELSFSLSTPANNDFARASSDYRFAVAVALFGQSLRQSRYATGYSLSELRSIADAARGEDERGLRAEFVRLIESVIAIRGERTEVAK